MKKLILFGLFVSLMLAIEPAIASPGGKIASAVFETFWGRIILAVLTIIFLPLIIYIIICEKLSEQRARKDLRYMARYTSLFELLKIQERVKDCFFRVHSEWKKEGLINICGVKKITKIKPILFVHRNEGAEHENSMIVIFIEAKMKDYLKKRDSGKVVEGSKRYKVVETVWSFVLENGLWKVSDIEEGSMSMTYAKLVNELPKIESTVVSELRES